VKKASGHNHRAGGTMRFKPVLAAMQAGIPPMWW